MSPNYSDNKIIPKLWVRLQNLPVIWRSLILIISYLAVGLALKQIAYVFRSSEQVQPWNPTAGWHIVFLFGFGLRYGLAIPLVSTIESVTLRSQEAFTLGAVNGVYVAIFATGCSALLLYKLDLDPCLYRLKDVVKFAVVSFFGSLAYGITNITTLLVLGKIERTDWLVKVMHESAGEATGIVMLAPPLLILLRKFPWSDKRLNLQGAAPDISFSFSHFEDREKWLGLFVITIIFTWLAYGGITSKDLDYTYLTFVPLTVICAWKGFELTTIVTMLINVIAVVAVGTNAKSPDTFALQFGLMTVTYVGLLLSAFVSGRNEENTKRKDLEERLRYDATHDSLTNLYNRAWFLDRLEQTKKKAGENRDYSFALLFLDLDRFKTINDNLGHAAGDLLLVQIAQKLQECLPESALVARLGGDEFTILLEELTDVSQVSQVAATICQHLRQTYTINGYEVFTTVSVGVAIHSDGDRNFNLLRNADIALYKAKAKGNQYIIFDSQMYDSVMMQAQLEQDLRQAINELNN